MARGVPLTPAQIATAAEVFERTGSYSDAARAIGATPQAARRAILRGGASRFNRVQLHARAIGRGIRIGRRCLATALEHALPRLEKAADGREYGAVVNAIARATDALLALDERTGRRSQARLTREKTRVEIELLRGRIAGTLPAAKHDVRAFTNVDVTNLGAIEERLAELLAGGVQPAAPRPAGGSPVPGGDAGEVARGDPAA